MTDRRGLLIILSSPSGAGKSTLAKRLMAWDPEISFSVSATTRKPRPGEVDGVDYYFKTHAEFADMVEKGEMLEHAQVFDHYYGSPKASVQKAIEAGRDVLFDVDWQGGQQVRASSLGANVLTIFILPPSIAELERRLHSRAQDSAEVIARRMQKSAAEISHWPEYDFIIFNDDLDEAEAQLKTIVSAARLRRSQQPALVERVRALDAEFKERQ